MKRCNKCLETKAYTFFNKDKKSPDKFSYSCKSCNIISWNTWADKNKEKLFNQRKKYELKNKNKLQKYHKRRVSERYNSDEIYRLIIISRQCVRDAINNQIIPENSKRKLFIGCDWETLKNHLESKFQNGMSWCNRKQWQIDHIIPLSRATSKEEVYKLSQYINIQPLWPSQNRKKGNK